MHKNYVFIYYSATFDAGVILYYFDKGINVNSFSPLILVINFLFVALYYLIGQYYLNFIYNIN